MATGVNRRKRSRGAVEKLPSGSLRVKVYAGIDPVTKRRHYLTEVVPAGPGAETEAERVLTRLLNEVDERRNPKTNATVEQLVTRYLDKHFDGEPSTRSSYRRNFRLHVRPFIGQEKVGRLDADALDSLYAELRRCRDHCDGSKRRIDHRTKGKHECDQRCKPHVCRPLGASTIRHVHFLLSGAYKRAVRWKWVSVSPVSQAEPPAALPPRPTPPTAAEAAQILNRAWQLDEDWGAFVWAAMTTGARRAELCALCWKHVDLDAATMTLMQAVAFDDERKLWYIKDTKTHQQRRIALDAETVTVLADLLAHRQRMAEEFGVTLDPEAYVFSPDPDGNNFPIPDSVGQRYDRMTARLGLKTSLHKLRHYSATELITAGVDPRTVAGRLGHGGGGTTTLKVYSAWVSEADQRASETLFSRVPPRPVGRVSASERAKTAPESPYERIAFDLRQQIAAGELDDGDAIPAEKKLRADYDVSAGTAHRAVELLKTWGLVETSRGRPTTIAAGAAARVAAEQDAAEPAPPAEPPTQLHDGPELLQFQVRRLGEVVRTFTAEVDPTEPSQLRALLVSSVRRDGHDVSEILDYELDVRRPDGELLTTFVTMSV